MPRTKNDETNKKSSILQAAYELFIENGYDNTSLKMIAERAGVARGHAYYFFESKESLFDEVLHMAQDNYRMKMYAAVQEYAHLTPEEFVEKCVDVILDFREEALLVMTSVSVPKLRHIAEPLLKEYSEGIIKMIEPFFPGVPDERLYNIGSILLAISDSLLIDGDRERAVRTAVYAIKIFINYPDNIEGGIKS